MAVNAPSPDTPLRIGTRGSPLALAQAYMVRDALMATHGLSEAAFAITPLKTTGDTVQDRPLSEIGGKGLFTKELEVALRDDAIDIAVHSMKDVPTRLQDGHVISAVLPREDVRDVLVSRHFDSIDTLPHGAVFGTSSLRRRAQLLAMRPDLKMVDFRGNVQTRMQKLEDGIALATLLARAGLKRLEQPEIGFDVPTTTLLPAIAQGAVGIEQREDEDLARFLAPIHDEPSAKRITAERAFLRALDGSCRTPIAGLAELVDGQLHFNGEVLRPDGSQTLRAHRQADASDAQAMGIDAAQELLAQGSAEFF
jgi:hydroxymethylbilane synthase